MFFSPQFLNPVKREMDIESKKKMDIERKKKDI